MGFVVFNLTSLAVPGSYDLEDSKTLTGLEMKNKEPFSASL